MKSHIKVAVPLDSDPEITEKLLAAIREDHSGYDLILTQSATGKYHWDGGFIHPSESARSNLVEEDEGGNLVVSESYVSMLPLGGEITSIIARVTGHTR